MMFGLKKIPISFQNPSLHGVYPQHTSNQYPISISQQQHQQMVETKYLMTRPGPMGSQGQATAAATFFAKANQG